MKTQVIQLDVHDDVISIRDKMSWVKAPRLLLVFPRRSQLLERVLDLQLLQRHASHLGVEIGLVSRSPEVRQIAGELGIPIFDSTKNAQRQKWVTIRPNLEQPPRKSRLQLRGMREEIRPGSARWQDLPSIRVGVFALAVLVVLALLAFFIPSAAVTLEPVAQTQKIDIEVNAGQVYTSINLAGNLPAHTAVIEIEGTRTAPATGSARIPGQKAEGMVRFRNLTTQPIGIPSGTLVQSVGNPPSRFLTTADGVIQGGVGNTVDVPVQAVTGGSAGNLPAGSLIAIGGDLGASLAVTNPAPTDGGNDRQVSLPTSYDRSKLHDALLEDLRQKAIQSIPGTLAPGDVFFPDSLTLNQVITETYIPGEGQPGDMLSLDLTIRFAVTYVEARDMQTLARAVLDAGLPSGYLPRAGEIRIQLLTQPEAKTEGTFSWQIRAERSIQPRIDPSLVAQAIRGSARQKAGQKLSALFPLAVAPIIRTDPSWWPWLPWLTLRTTTEIK